MTEKAENVGIIDIEVYFPKLYVEQKDMEAYVDVPNKFTLGLGQLEMSFCSVLEDSVSMAMTVVHRLLKRTGLKYTDFGRVDVGSESPVDQSKSIKSFLMSLFNKHGNFEVEGADNVNACYGGTAALFNCVNWMESSYWNGKHGLVVMSDISTYDPSKDLSAVSTSGAGAICLLIGPNAPLVFRQGCRSHYMIHGFDFFKPIKSYFPIVDGKKSLQTYIECLLRCFNSLKPSCPTCEFSLVDGKTLFAFHCPYSKLVTKSFSYLHYFNKKTIDEKYSCDSVFEKLRKKWRSNPATLKEFESKITSESADCMKLSVTPSLMYSKRIGNIYCSSLYLCLCSILSHVDLERLKFSKIAMYSYGSGSLSSMFILDVNHNEINKLQYLIDQLKQSFKYLNKRTKVDVPTMIKSLEDRKIQFSNNIGPFDYDPAFLWDSCYYLTQIDEKYMRFYNYYDK